jgi:ribosomal protein L12E/L44/L45/RPP1/RPP2
MVSKTIKKKKSKANSAARGPAGKLPDNVRKRWAKKRESEEKNKNDTAKWEKKEEDLKEKNIDFNLLKGHHISLNMVRKNKKTSGVGKLFKILTD